MTTLSATPPARRLMTPRQVGEALQVGRTSVYALIGAGALECVRIGRSVRVPTESVERFIEERRSIAQGLR